MSITRRSRWGIGRRFSMCFRRAWTLIFSSHRASVMLLLALLAAVLSALVFHVAQKEFSTPIAVTAGLMVVINPLVRAYSRQVMSDLMIATIIFACLVCYAKYLDTGRDWLSISFGILAAVAGLTKATGFILAGIPPFGVLLTRRFPLLRNPSFWAAAAIVVVLAGPWYYLAPGATHESALPASRVVRASPNLSALLQYLFRTVAGIAVIPFSVIGLVVFLAIPLLRRQPIRGIWAVSAASIISMLVMLAIVSPSRSPRHLIIILSPLLLFAVAGVVWVVSRKPFQTLSLRWRTVLAVLILAGLLLADYRQLRVKEYTGFAPVAEQIISNGKFNGSAILVSSDASGEGMFISEVAARDTERPVHTVVRATKLISQASWFGRNALVLYKTAEELGEFLRSLPIGLIVFDTDPPRRPPHHTLLEQMLKSNPHQWQLLATFPQHRGHGDVRGDIRVYRLVGCEGKPRKKLPSQLRGYFQGK